ncbi:MAG: electron transfer flavoprotein subunit alpha/FixB family protein [Firmicutes bacterium]|nr:electron transfer flavoprotein subunit alpha/FixB family protein [Bacillota bacterium]
MAGFIKENGLDPAKGTTLLIGKELPENAEELLPTKSGAFLKADCGRAEEVLKSVAPLCREQLILFAPDSFCEELAVRLSVRLGGTSMTDALGIFAEDGAVRIERRIYGGHLTGTFLLKKGPFLISLSRSLDEADPVSGEIEETVTAEQVKESDRKITPVPAGSDLEEAKTVVIGGRGLRSRDGAERLAEMASKMGAAVGGSRPVIMNAWMKREKLVGVSGAMIHPELCIVCGASGSPAFYEGIRRSKTILAVNTDERAPIMKKADACVCADWQEVMKALTGLIAKER